MATETKKREAPNQLGGYLKKLRIGQTQPEEHFPSDEDDDDEKDSYRGNDELSEQDDGVDTPVTPFSPARKKFPSELKTIKCTHPGCEKTFNRPARLESHMRIHNNERACICPFEGCDKSYFEEKHLQQHIKGTHKQERQYVCDWEGCGKAFVTGTRLRRHKEAHEGKERFRCTAYPPCNHAFRKHQTLQRHIRSDHLQLAPFPCTYVDPITKTPCGAGFDGSSGLRKHEERVHTAPRFFCTSCTIPGSFNADRTPARPGFSNESQLQSHIRKEHVSCLFCDLKCSSQRELQKHIETQHSGKSLEERKNIPCPHYACGKTFTKKSNLSIHIRTTHKGERFICGTFDVSSNPTFEEFDPSEDACGKDFMSKANLEDHIRTAHLNLPSLINRSRKKTDNMDDDFMDDSNEDFLSLNKKQKKRKPRKQKPSAIDELLGNSYAADPSRNIPCLVQDCAYMFIRNYDLQQHLRAGHDIEGSPATETSFAFLDGYNDQQQFLQGNDIDSFNPTRSLPQNFGQDTNSFPINDENQPLGPEAGISYTAAPPEPEQDIDWELQRRALEGGPFWIGADDRMSQYDGGQNQDGWTREEEEMRRLIGSGMTTSGMATPMIGDEEGLGLIDPKLM